MTTDRSERDLPAYPTASPAACDCCPDLRISTHFDKLTRERTADGALPPMVAVTERLLGQLTDVGDVRPTVLELGCGSGALLVELLSRGASAADGVDLSAEAIATAQRRAADAGVADRVHFEAGDAARVAHAAHDWVVLDRAICCYPDMAALLAAAAGAARSRIAFSVPTSRGLRGLFNRIGWGLEALLTRTPFQRGVCPGYVHDVNDIERRLASAGFLKRSSDTTLLWYAAVWERPAPA